MSSIKYYQELTSAIRFLTILPIGHVNTGMSVAMVRFFPIVGLLIGGILAIVHVISSQLWETSVVALVDVITLALITGALHIDGLADTADGLLGHLSKEKAMAVMKDSRIGAMALIAVISFLSLKWAGLYSIGQHPSIYHRLCAMIIIPAYARTSVFAAMQWFSYGTGKRGIGYQLFESKLTHYDYALFVIPVILSLTLGWMGIALNVVFCITVTGVIFFYQKRLGVITGDMMGAMIECMESILFLAVGSGGFH
ncbi:MAG: adenosylcobinamide-GDP ribazoletransferase [Desulfobacterales bacterium]|nr:adenosylcobinamide-GDP ribazoletransferase [Desulfobacterales bacterium]